MFISIIALRFLENVCLVIRNCFEMFSKLRMSRGRDSVISNGKDQDSISVDKFQSVIVVDVFATC